MGLTRRNGVKMGFEKVDCTALLHELNMDVERAVALLEVHILSFAYWQQKGEMPTGVADYLRHLARGGEKYRLLPNVSPRRYTV